MNQTILTTKAKSHERNEKPGNLETPAVAADIFAIESGGSDREPESGL
jgi:hypothetical protein